LKELTEKWETLVPSRYW